MAKRFFYVCAGLLCLALTYHLGARRSSAQAGLGIEGGNLGTWNTCAVGRTFYYQVGGLFVPEPIPGTDRVVATGGAPVRVMLENGDVYVYPGDPSGGSSWQFVGNMIGSPISVEPSSWGSVKARYRGELEPESANR